MDDLQTLWRKGQSPQDEAALGLEQVHAVIHQKSRSEFDKFKRVVFWEILFNVFFTLGCVYYVLVSELRQFPAIMGASFLLIGSFLGWQFNFYRRLRRHPVDANVHRYLRSALALLKKYVLHYKVVYGIILPISGILGFFLGFSAGKAGIETPFYELPQNPWLALLLAAIILGLAFTAIHLQFKYLYQPKIDRIQNLVDELQS